MATRYAVNTPFTWNGTAGTKWAGVSGGGGGAAVPTASDDVIFDGNSGTGAVTISGSRVCKSLTTTLFGGSFTAASTPILTVSGSVTLGPVDLAIGTGMVLRVNNAGSFHSDGGDFPDVDIRTSGQVTMTSDVTLGSLGISGNPAGCSGGTANITVGNVSISGANIDFSMGSGTWELTGTNQVWVCDATASINIVPQTSTIKITDTSSAQKFFYGGGKHYYNIWGPPNGDLTIVDSNTFNDIRVDAGSDDVIFQSGTTTTITSLTISGASGDLVGLRSSGSGAWNLSCASGNITVDYCLISDSHAAGGANFRARHSTDGGGNTGWNFTNAGAQMMVLL